VFSYPLRWKKNGFTDARHVTFKRKIDIIEQGSPISVLEGHCFYWSWRAWFVFVGVFDQGWSSTLQGQWPSRTEIGEPYIEVPTQVPNRRRRLDRAAIKS